MSVYIGFPEYNGTLERDIALILDHELITFDRTNQTFVLRDHKAGFDGITAKIAQRIRERQITK